MIRADGGGGAFRINEELFQRRLIHISPPGDPVQLSPVARGDKHALGKVLLLLQPGKGRFDFVIRQPHLLADFERGGVVADPDGVNVHSQWKLWKPLRERLITVMERNTKQNATSVMIIVFLPCQPSRLFAPRASA